MMMRLVLGSNNVALTLTEKVTISDPNYLFVFEQSSDYTKKYYCVAADTSEYPNRYNLFDIKVKANPNALNGEVNLPIGGEYIYRVYQQSSTTNLNPDYAEGEVEVGFMTYDK